MSTYSDKRLRNAMRSFQSKAFEGGTSYIGSKLPFDEQVNSALLGVVDVFFPDDLQIRFYHRDTLVDDGRPSKTGYAYLVVDTPLKTEEVQNWMSNIPGTSTTDKKTGKPCIVPSNDYICTVEAIKGDPDIDTVAFICLGFLLMRGEEFEGREVEPFVTGSDVDSLVPDIAETAIFDEFEVSEQTGRMTLKNGLYIEWGYHIFPTAVGRRTQAITFTHTFQSAPSLTTSHNNSTNGYVNVYATSLDGSGFTLSVNTEVSTSLTARWLAIGKRTGY